MSGTEWCRKLLQDGDSFRVALLQFVDGKDKVCVEGKSADKVGEEGIIEILLLIDFVLEMLRDVGLSVQHKVYTALKHRLEPPLETADGWHTCAFSALQSCRCLRVDDETTVHEDYSRWMLSVWLVTHMQELEQQRRRASGCPEIPTADVELYRSALAFVLEQLEVLYARVCTAQLGQKKLAT